jgi:hypothetical protein
VLVLVNDTDWELWCAPSLPVLANAARPVCAVGMSLVVGGCLEPERMPAHHACPLPPVLRSGELEAAVAEGDRVTFISTLHGG